MTEQWGLYLHFPFCRRKCLYCDFYSVPLTNDKLNGFTVRMCREMEEKGREYPDAVFDTLFVGGGTPSLGGEKLCRILDKALTELRFTPDAEISAEGNPESVTAEGMRALKAAGVNRVSIGAQSLCDDELRDLGRIHSRDSVFRAYENVRKAGIENVNIDLMFAVGHKFCKEKHIDVFSRTLDDILTLSPEHISAYGLQIMPHTPLCERREEYIFPREEEEDEMAALLCERLAEHGYRHYEISNFAKPGRECRHNLKYWNGGHYLGLGPSARSYIGERRFGVASDLDAYIAGTATPETDEIVNKSERAYEHLMLGARLTEGVFFEKIKDEFDLPGMKEYLALLEKNGLIKMRDDGFSLTEHGFRVSNGIINQLSDYRIKGR